MTQAQKRAREKLNPTNLKGYSKVVIHSKGILCGTSSAYGLQTTSDSSIITCITCRRLLGHKKAHH